MNNRSYGFFQDINGDMCPRTMMGVLVGIAVLILSFITIIYGLTHVIHSSTYIIQLMIGLIGLVGTLLVTAAFAKQRNECGGKNE